MKPRALLSRRTYGVGVQAVSRDSGWWKGKTAEEKGARCGVGWSLWFDL